jgi:hypothetical protein
MSLNINGRTIKGEDGPTVDICAQCHNNLHAQAVNSVAKKARRRDYFTDEQAERAKPYLRLLTAALLAQEEKSACALTTVMVQFSGAEMERLKLAQRDANYTNLATFVHDLTIRSLTAVLGGRNE